MNSITKSFQQRNTSQDPPEDKTPDEIQAGLVLPAISGRNYVIYNTPRHAVVTIYADYVETTVTKVARDKTPSLVEGTKKPITTFSRKSRKTMFRKMGKIRDLNASYFVTLTYPGLFDFTPAECKAHLAAFRKRFLRQYTEAGFVWRLELKQRQTGASEGRIAPHFHMLIMKRQTGRFLDLIANIKRWWNEILFKKERRWEQAALDHFKAGTSVERMKSRKQAVSYLSKYIAKVEQVQMSEQDCKEWGRHWGISGHVDARPMARFEIDRSQYIQLRRLIASAMKARARKKRFDKQGNPLPRKKKVFGLKIRNGGSLVSWGALGYGDQSNNKGSWKKSLIYRLLTTLPQLGKNVYPKSQISFMDWLTKHHEVSILGNERIYTLR